MTAKYWITDELELEDYVTIYPDGTKLYYKDGKLHREGGPAIEYSNGDTEYWIDNKRLTARQFDLRRMLRGFP